MSNLEYLKIGPRIAAARKAAGMTQADLAAEMETDQQVISRYEQDVVGNMALKKILEFAETIGIHPSELIGFGAVPTPPPVAQAPAPAPMVQVAPQSINAVMAMLYNFGATDPAGLHRVFQLLKFQFENESDV